MSRKSIVSSLGATAAAAAMMASPAQAQVNPTNPQVQQALNGVCQSASEQGLIQQGFTRFPLIPTAVDHAGLADAGTVVGTNSIAVQCAVNSSGQLAPGLAVVDRTENRLDNGGRLTDVRSPYAVPAYKALPEKFVDWVVLSNAGAYTPAATSGRDSSLAVSKPVDRLQQVMDRACENGPTFSGQLNYRIFVPSSERVQNIGMGDGNSLVRAVTTVFINCARDASTLRVIPGAKAMVSRTETRLTSANGFTLDRSEPDMAPANDRLPESHVRDAILTTYGHLVPAPRAVAHGMK